MSVNVLPRLRSLARRASFHVAPLLGRKQLYHLPAGYVHRTEEAYFDDTGNADEWQREVYEAARALMSKQRLRTVVDVGCGSGFKLVHSLGEFETIGIDLSETVTWLRRAYPQHRWLDTAEAKRLPLEADLVICADVIEHVADPDALMRFVMGITRSWVVLSTPDRHLMYKPRDFHRLGPPRNPAHLREWSFGEFGRYAAQFLDIESHVVSNRDQSTQMVVGRVRR